MHKTVFISYPFDDCVIVRNVVNELQGRGIKVLWDERPHAVKQLRERVDGLMKQADAVIAFATSLARKGNYFHKEIDKATSLEKDFILVCESDAIRSRFECLANIGYIEFDRTRPESITEALVQRIQDGPPKTSKPTNILTARPSGDSSDKPLGDLRELDEAQLKEIFLLNPGDSSEHLVQLGRDVMEVLQRGRQLKWINLNTLSADSQVLVIRFDTLHALMNAQRAIGAERPHAFRVAGYEAGLLYALSLLKWLLKQSERIYHAPGLPQSARALLDACVVIDEESKWGTINLNWDNDFGKKRPDEGKLKVTISDDFLAHGLEDNSSWNTIKESEHALFWASYVEGAYTCLLATSHALFNRRHASLRGRKALLAVRCTKTPKRDGKHLELEVEISLPKYSETLSELVQKFFLPHVAPEKDQSTDASVVSVLGNWLFSTCELQPKGYGVSETERALGRCRMLVNKDAKPAINGLLELVKYSRSSYRGSGSNAERKDVVRRVCAAILIACRAVHMRPNQKQAMRKFCAK